MTYNHADYEHLRQRIIQAVGERECFQLEEILQGLDGLRKVALSNQVTGAPGAGQLDEDLAEMKNKRKSSDHREEDIYVVMIDIDNFGRFNKVHGETVGNDVLRSVTGIINETLRDDDLVVKLARNSYGYHLHGEEMLALYTCRNLADAKRVAERLCRNVEQMTLRDVGHGVTISAGVTRWNTSIEPYQMAQDRADRCMQFAKREGKNRIYCAEADPLFSFKEGFYQPGILDESARVITEAVKSVKGIMGRCATSLYTRIISHLSNQRY